MATTKEQKSAIDAAADAAGADVVEAAIPLPTETVAEEPAKMPPLILQSKYRNHSFQLKAPRRIYRPEVGIVEPVPGVWARFTGPQRIFNSEVAQEEFGWTDLERDSLERKLVTDKAFMVDFYPAPMCPLPEHLLEIATRKPPTRVKKCFAFGFADGTPVQCSQNAAAGSDYCDEHDPDKVRIIKGGGTTIG
jgi:hypothetical protein